MSKNVSADSAALEENQAHRQVPLDRREGVLEVLFEKMVTAAVRFSTDSNWAGDLETRKSTRGGIIMLGEHCLKIWSTNQSSPRWARAKLNTTQWSTVRQEHLECRRQRRNLCITVEDLSVETATDFSGAKFFSTRQAVAEVQGLRGTSEEGQCARDVTRQCGQGGGGGSALASGGPCVVFLPDALEEHQAQKDQRRPLDRSR